MNSNFTDKVLEERLTKCQTDLSQLEPLLVRYAEIAAASKQNVITHYAKLIEEVCVKWEQKGHNIAGIKNLSAALTNYYSAKFQDVLAPCRIALEILENSSQRNLFGLANMIFGANYRSLGELDQAVKYLIRGAEIIDDEGEISIYKCYSYYQLAEINVQINDNEAAEKNYRKAVELAQELNNKAGLFRAYNGLANLYLSTGKPELCKEHLDLSLNIESLSDSQKSRSYCDLGIYYYTIKEYDNSLKNLKISYDFRKKAGLKDAMSTSLINIAKTYLVLDQKEQAMESLEEALRISLEYMSKSKLQQCYHLLADVYSRKEKWKLANDAYQKYDQLQIELSTKQLQNIYRLKNEEIKKQKQVIENFYEEIQDSIRYAKRIQSAILPSEKIAKNNLKEHFILYKPKDIVAGDFYWIEKMESKTLFAVADCTGHGVPGALVSVICNNALNRSVREYGLTDPGMILDKTREIVIREFEKSDEEVKDGMDIALCSLEGDKLYYSGANNPLWIIRKGELLETKANKQPIGRSDYGTSFNTHTFDLEDADTIYIFSDGYVDQFGGEKGKKFKTKAFKNLLLSFQNKSMLQQKQILEQTLQNWKGKLEQVDDICVIGLKI